jgi:hypothetical protein
MIDTRFDRESTAPRLHADGQPGLHRRGLLAAAASGLALGAGGLLLPARLVGEAAAGEKLAGPMGAYGGRLGGRRGKDRRGRDKAKRRNDKNDAPRNAPRGAAPGNEPHVRWIKFHVYNDRPTTNPNPSVIVTPWARFAEWAHYPNSTLPNGQAITLPLRSATEGAVVIDGRFYVGAINYAIGTPQVILQHSGTMTATGYQNAAGPAYVRELLQGEEVTRVISGRQFRITRLRDSDDYIEFDIHFT